MKIAIVTTCLNPGKWLEETMKSVLSQSGDFFIYYHIQDAGSTDGTLGLLNDQFQEIERNNLAIQCRGITFGYSSEPDNGMYDGINKGFRKVLNENQGIDLMMWINSDDRLIPNALSFVVKCFTDNPTIDWVLGRTVHINEVGDEIYNTFPHSFRRIDIAEGKCDGIQLPYITQEACVWRKKVWKSCGELNSRLKFAGDYEYWIRLANAGFFLIPFNMGIGEHRKHTAQLSAGNAYRHEINLIKSKRISFNY